MMSGLIPGQNSPTGSLTPFGSSGPLGGTNPPNPFQQKIFLLETYVAGLSYAENLEEIEVFLVPGFRLEFLRDPKNTYDEMAIQIFIQPQGVPKKRIGYVPRRKNEILARLMDAGKYLYGIIQEKKNFGNSLNLTIHVFMED